MTASVVAVVGCGNIGSRCLQALCDLGRGVDVFAVDPSEDALAVASTRVDELAIEERPNISFASDLGSLPGEVDLALVTTCADVRMSAVEQLFGNSRIGHLVLEKFLFQRFSEYDALERLLVEHDTPCWVSLPRRAWPGYQMLKERLGNGPVDMIVRGHDFRLASNAIHLIDIYSYVADDHVCALDGSGLSDAGQSSRRERYLECYGTLQGESENGGKISLTSSESGSEPFIVEFQSASLNCIIDEAAGQARFAERSKSAEHEIVDFKTLFMSEMSPVYASLIENGRCALPKFAASKNNHLALIEVFNRRWFGDAWKETPCPVT